MEWDQLTERLYAGDKVAITLVDGTGWFQEFDDVLQLKANLESKMEGLASKVGLGDGLLVWTPIKVHPYCIDNPVTRFVRMLPVDRPYFERLLKAKQEVVPVEPKPGSIANDCHRNAWRWVSAHGGYQIVSGWLFEDCQREHSEHLNR